MYESKLDGFHPTSLKEGRTYAVGEFPPGDTPDGSSHPPRTNTALVPAFYGKFELRNPSISARHNWNPFTHYSRVTDVFTKPFHWHSPSTSWMDSEQRLHYWRYRKFFSDATVAWSQTQFGGFDEPFGSMPKLYEIDPNGVLFVPPPVDLGLLLQRALDSILPQIKPQTSLINSLIELKDFRSLPHTLSHIKDTLGHLYKDASLVREGTVLDKFGHMSMREILRRKADIFLQWKFNIQPLLNDINGCFKAIKSYQRAAERLIRDQEQIKRHHFQIVIPSDQADYTQYTEPYALEFASGTTLDRFDARSGRFVSFRPAVFHVELEYQYFYTPWQRQHALLLTLLDELGVNFNPQIVWNAIPWSFVVDWFAGLGPWLGRFKMANMEPVIVVHKSLWSIKRQRETSCFVDAGECLGVPVSHVWETAYCRSSFDMNQYSVILSGLSLMEFSLATALGLSRRKRWRR